MIQSKDFLENLRRLVFTASFPVLHDNGSRMMEDVRASDSPVIVDKRQSSDGVAVNGELGLSENGSDMPVGELEASYVMEDNQVGIDGTIVSAQQSQAVEHT